jgi:hypothetical protein
MGLWGWLFGRKKAPFEQEWDGETEHEHGIRQLRRQTADTIKQVTESRDSLNSMYIGLYRSSSRGHRLSERQIKAAERNLKKEGVPEQIQEFNYQISELMKALSDLDETWAELRSQRGLRH